MLYMYCRQGQQQLLHASSASSGGGAQLGTAAMAVTVVTVVWREEDAASTGCLGASPLRPVRCAGRAVPPRTLCLAKATQSAVDGVRGG
jgi:hypothetical protein